MELEDKLDQLNLQNEHLVKEVYSLREENENLENDFYMQENHFNICKE